jgi:hypothetical protein
MFAHLANAFLSDAFDSAAPSRVKNADGSTFPVHDDDRKAIRCLHSQNQTRRIRNQSVASQNLIRHSIHSMD